MNVQVHLVSPTCASSSKFGSKTVAPEIGRSQQHLWTRLAEFVDLNINRPCPLHPRGSVFIRR